MSGYSGPYKVDPNAICPASGMTNRSCMASICDCFPNEDDRFGIHPEYFEVGTPVCARCGEPLIAGMCTRPHEETQ